MVAAAARGGGSGDAGRAGVRRRGRRDRGHADLHGAAVTRRPSARACRSCRRWARTSSIAGGPGAGQAAKICNNMMLAHQHGRGVARGFCSPTSSAWTRQKFCGHRLDLVRPVLGAVELVPRARPGAGGAIQPRLRARLHGGADAEGHEAVAGGGRGGGRRRRRSPRTPRRFYQAIVDAGEARKDFRSYSVGLTTTARNRRGHAEAGRGLRTGSRGGVHGGGSFKAARDSPVRAPHRLRAPRMRGVPLAEAGHFQLGARLVRCRTGAAAPPPTSRP